MKKTSKQELLDDIASVPDADIDKSFVKLFIRMPSGETETISNPNIREKAKYIDKAYDDNLCLKTFPAIHIVDFEVHTDYRKGISFGEVIEQLKNGYTARRRGWNGKNQYIELATNVSYKNAKSEIVNVDHKDMGNKAIAFVGTSGVQLGWLASQPDMLSEDWEIVERNLWS